MHHRYPLFRPFLFHVSGIALSYFFFCRFPDYRGWHPAVQFLPFLLFCAMLCSHLFIRYRTRTLFGWLLLPLFFCLGWISVQCRCQEAADSLAHATGDKTFYRAELCAPPVLREKSVRLDVRLKAVRSASGWEPLREKCRLTLARDSASESLAYGDVFWFCAALKPVAPPLNEGEFSYARYLFRHGVVRQGYLASGQWELAGPHGGNPLLRLSAYWHRQVFLLLKESRLNAASKGLVSTMLLGDDTLLDPETGAAFSKAGVSHVLCVSGMHVGILYMMINYLLFFMERNRRLRQIKSLLHVVVIWCYACMVGLAPSVTRAAVMFTFVAAGGLFRRKTMIYNSLLTSAFVMLLVQPMLLFETGFQMSYLAVWGIVSTQPALQRLWSPRNRLLRYLRDVWTVSLSAQLFTAPVSMFCFHSFPLYFLLSNVVVVSMAPVVIGMALLYMVVSFQPMLSGGVAWMLDRLVWLMHGGVAVIGGLPGASVGPIVPDGVQLALLYMLLCFTLLWLQRKKVCWLGMALSCLLLCLGDGVCRAVANRTDRELALYAIPHHYAVEYGDARSTMVFTDDPEALLEGRFDYQMQGSRLRHGRPLSCGAVPDSLSETWVCSGGYFQFGTCSFLHLEGRFCADSAFGPVSFPDYLLVGDSTRVRPEKVLSTLVPGCVCVLPGVSQFRVGHWRAACAERGIPFVDMGKAGMLRLCIDRQ